MVIRKDQVQNQKIFLTNINAKKKEEDPCTYLLTDETRSADKLLSGSRTPLSQLTKIMKQSAK
jgi:hypothetical protein